jgi:hypothetical protein
MNYHQGVFLGDKVIHDILKYINLFYQGIKNGENTKEHDSPSWRSLKNSFQENQAGSTKYNHKFCTTTNRVGLVWIGFSHLMREKILQLIPNYPDFKDVIKSVKQPINKIIYVLRKEQEKLD